MPQQTESRPTGLSRCLRRAVKAIAAAVVAVWWPAPSAQAIVTDPPHPDLGRIVINIQVGADRFYDNGYFGRNAFIANVEAGHVWDLHETLNSSLITYVNDVSTASPKPAYDSHATAVGFTMVGLGPYDPNVGYYYYQFGMAPLAALVSTAIATSFVPNTGEFEITTQSLVYGYRTVMQTGAPRMLWPGISIDGQRVDVVNSSWGFDDPTGRAQETMTIDALAYANHQTVCLAAGNSASQVIGPSSGYNSISVGALESGTSTPPYGQRAAFSSFGPNDFYNPVTKAVIPGVRATVDITAPGTDLILAAYTGATGGNTGGTDPWNGNTGLYYFGAAGTSFASPIVAGGAALLVDAGYLQFKGGVSVDGRVIKAVLLNSAQKPAGWTNHSTLNGGVLRTTQALDWQFGAGSLDLNHAYDQYLSQTADITLIADRATVGPIGWDFGQVTDVSDSLYFLNRPLLQGEIFAATLDWFVNRSLDPVTNIASDVAFNELDLQLWLVSGGELDRLVAESTAHYNNVQHLYLAIPDGGDYALRVLWGGNVYYDPLLTSMPHGETYGLAWAVLPAMVPLPGAALAGAVLLALVAVRRR